MYLSFILCDVFFGFPMFRIRFISISANFFFFLSYLYEEIEFYFRKINNSPTHNFFKNISQV